MTYTAATGPTETLVPSAPIGQSPASPEQAGNRTATGVRRLTMLVLAGAIAAFGASATDIAVRLQNQRVLFAETLHTCTLATLHAHSELLRLSDGLSRAQIAPSQSSIAALTPHLTALTALVPSMRVGSTDPRPASPPMATVGDVLARHLPQLTSAIQTLSADRPESFAKARAEIDRLRPAIEDAVSTVLPLDSALAARDRIIRMGEELTMAMALLAACGSLLIVLLLAQTMRGRRLFRAAERARQEAQDARANLIAGLDAVEAGFLLSDAAGRVIYANARYCALMPDMCELLCPGADLHEIERRAAARGLFLDEEGRPIPVDRWFGWRRERADGDDGRLQRLRSGHTLQIFERTTAGGGQVAIAVDVTRRRADEELLRRRLAALEASFDGIAMLDATGAFTYVNPAHAVIYGFNTPDELLGRSWHVLYAEETWRRIERQVMPGFLRTGRARFEATALRQDGRSFEQEVSLAALPDGGLVCLVRDVTDRHRIERAHKESEERFAAIARVAPMSMLIACKETDKVLWCNERLADMLGVTSADLIGRPLSAIYADGQPPAPQPSGASPVPTEVTVQGADGQIVAAVETAVEMPFHDSGCVLRCLIDVRALKDGEIERAYLREQLFHAQKREAIGLLTGGISHDFNNILAAILGYASILAEDLPPGSELHRYACQILAGGERGKELVRHILSHTRGEDAEKQPIAIGTIVDETASLLRATLPSTIRFDVQDQSKGAVALANTSQLSQVLMNLCVNARDAIGPDGGRLTVRVDTVDTDGGCADGLSHKASADGEDALTRIVEQPDGTLRLWLGILRPPGRHVRLTIEDSGCGMSRAVLQRMFQPFFTTKEKGRGSGLGLAAVRRIVRDHAGALTVRTRPGDGTTIEVLLPAHAGKPVDCIRLPNARPIIKGHGRVLVIDDEEEVAAVTALGLERMGFDASYEVDPQVALETLERAPDDWDAIVTDQTMPGITGAALARRLLGVRPDIPVVLCTGYTDAIDEDGARSIGITAFFNKPVDISSIGEVLAAAIPQPDPDTQATMPTGVAIQPMQAAEPHRAVAA